MTNGLDILKQLGVVREALSRRLVVSLRAVETLQKDIAEIDSLMKRYAGQQQMDLSSDEISTVAKDFFGMSLRQSIGTILRREAGTALNAAKIEAELKSGGYQTKSPYLRDQISTMMSNMYKRGELIRDKPGWYYVPPEE